MEFRQYLEATEPFKDKLFDPALLTWEEFWEKVNPHNKWHPDSAYDWTLDKFKEKKTNFPQLLFRRPINGINFEFRVHQEDNYKDNVFARRGPDGEYLRIDGQLQYYTRDELLKLNRYRRYDYKFAAFHGEQCVGVTQDEWGCLLVSVAPEYRQFGLGQMLTKMAWEAEPGKDTGGCTNRGAVLTRRVHAEFVHDYLQKGFYSHLVKAGKLTLDRVNAILKSAQLQQKPVPKRDLGTDDPENWLMFHEDGVFIVYDKKFKDFYQEEGSHWKDRCIKAIGDVGGMLHENENYRLRTLGGESEKLKRFMLLCCLTWTAEEGKKPLYVYEEDLPLVDKTIGKVKKERGSKNGWVSLVTQPVDYKPLEGAERAWRRKFDKYDEFKVILMETAYAKYQ
jgi:GNAT superfamily N-acetyltransferase